MTPRNEVRRVRPSDFCIWYQLALTQQAKMATWDTVSILGFRTGRQTAVV